MQTASHKHRLFPYNLNGINLSLNLHRDKLIIHRKGFVYQMRPMSPDTGDQEVLLRDLHHVELSNQMLVLNFYDADPVYVLFAPQDTHQAEQLAHVLHDMLVRMNHRQTRVS
jgi:hypothetical protein